MSAVMKPGAALPSLILSLIQIANSAVYLQGSSAVHTLRLRTRALQVIDMIVKDLLVNKETYYKGEKLCGKDV